MATTSNAERPLPSLRELVSKLGKPDALDLIPFGTVYSRANNLSEIRKKHNGSSFSLPHKTHDWRLCQCPAESPTRSDQKRCFGPGSCAGSVQSCGRRCAPIFGRKDGLRPCGTFKKPSASTWSESGHLLGLHVLDCHHLSRRHWRRAGSRAVCEKQKKWRLEVFDITFPLQLNNQSSDPHISSSSASSPAPSSTPISPSATASSPKLSCPANDTLSYTPISTSGPPSGPYQINGTAISYTIHCGYDYDASKDIDDMQWIPETNLTACIDLCSIFNVRLPYGGEFGFYSMCSGVTVTTKGTCQLKSGVEKGAINANKTGTGQSAMLNQGVF